ncbi:MAG: hypothetical protein ACREP5_11200, partial [Candidatus Binatia bacterium]
MRETVLEALIYIIDHPVLTLVLVFLSGFLASRIVLSDRRPGVLGFSIIGLLGFFLGHFMISYMAWNERLDGLRELRVIVEFLAACIGSFVIAGIAHLV